MKSSAPLSNWLRLTAASCALAAIPAMASTGTANATPAEDPCSGTMILICHFLPIAPHLEGDVDLVTVPPEQPPAPALQQPEAIADICQRGCI